MSYKGDQKTESADPEETTAERFLTHKVRRRARGLEPMPWGEWLAANQPIDAE